MEDKKLDFIIIPTKVLCHKKLTANAKLLMGEIINLCNSKGNCWASNSYLAEVLGIHKMTISKWINSLEKNGFIKCKVKSDTKRKIYIDPCISNSIELYVKSLIGYESNDVHIHKQSQLRNAGSAVKDDFEIESKEWTDKKGKKHKRISIDYGEKED